MPSLKRATNNRSRDTLISASVICTGLDGVDQRAVFGAAGQIRSGLHRDGRCRGGVGLDTCGRGKYP